MTNRLVIADPERCIGCYTCMAACVVNHLRVGLQASPRLIVTNTSHGTMPIQCHHCEDAPCEAVCPVKAITFAEESVQLNEGLCIGCKMCAMVCPYGAITPHGTTPPSLDTGFFERHTFSTEARWPAPLYGSRQSSQLHPILAWRIGQRAVAVKCDQCFFSESGPECVKVCPTKALSVIDAQILEQLSRSKRARAVADISAGD